MSLGWCFWHRGCFGCLVCGTKLDVPATVAGGICSEDEGNDAEKEEKLGKWDGSEDGAGAGVTQSARCIGVELEDIPMCTVCEVETAGESPDRVLERGLDTVTKSDGGLSRCRLDMLSEAKDPTVRSSQESPATNPRSAQFSLFPIYRKAFWICVFGQIPHVFADCRYGN